MTARKAQPLFFAVWPTAWGPVGAVASARGLRKFELPHYQPHDLREKLLWENPGAAEDAGRFEPLIQLTRDYFNGKVVDFGEVVCDLPGPATFAGKVLRACREIPYGRTLSYSALAYKVARPGAARAVATAVGRNPVPLVVPCHRVVYADGREGGFSAPGGVDLKKRMLEIERGAPGA